MGRSTFSRKLENEEFRGLVSPSWRPVRLSGKESESVTQSLPVIFIPDMDGPS